MAGRSRINPRFPERRRTDFEADFYSHPSNCYALNDVKGFYAKKILKKSANAARRAARKRFFNGKPTVGWAFRNRKFILVCPCQNMEVIDHRPCLIPNFSTFKRRKKREFFVSSKNSGNLPRGIKKELRIAAKSFHFNRNKEVEPMQKEEMANGLFEREKELKELRDVTPLTEDEKNFIDTSPKPRKELTPPADERPLLLKYTKELHPILKDVTFAPFSEGPKKAKRGKIGDIIKKYPNKGYVNMNVWKEAICFICKSKGHIAQNCDNLPTLRRMASTKEELYLRFWARQKPVVWRNSKKDLQGLIRSTPKIIERIERIARSATNRWGKAVPFEREWSFPRLARKAIPFYYAIGTPPSILTKLIAGETNRYIQSPERLEYSNHPSVYEEKEYMDSQIEDMSKRGIAIPIPKEYARVILPCKVVIGKKKRLVVNGIPINPFTPNASFNLPSISELTALVSHRKMVIIHFDLKDAFYSGAMAPDCAMDQCIRWTHPITRESQVFAMTQRIFGHHLSPKRFMRSQAMVFEFLRKLGFPACVFVDDGIILTLADGTLRKLTSSFIKRLLNMLWLIIKEEKSDLEGTTKLEWIGYDINLEDMTLGVPERHVKKIKKEIKQFIRKEWTTPKEIAKVKGIIISKRHAIRYASILTASINRALSEEFQRQGIDESFRDSHDHVSWSAKMRIPKEVKEDLTFLLEIIEENHKLPIFYYEWDLDIFTDSSATHTGGHSKLGEYFIPIPPRFINSSSTVRELWGILATLREHGDSIKGKKVRIFSDNLAVATITNRNASSRVELRIIHKEIVKLARELNIQFWIRWKRRNTTGIEIADALSKSLDYDEWVIDKEKLASFCDVFNLPYPTLDCFASCQNKVAEKYFSATLDPNAEGLDFFEQNFYDFGGEFTWINPPFQGSLIQKTVDFIISKQINGILCLPAWIRSAWYFLVRRFACAIIRVDRRVKLYTPNFGLKMRCKKKLGSPRWDSFLCIFNWDYKKKYKTDFFYTEDFKTFEESDESH